MVNDCEADAKELEKVCFLKFVSLQALSSFSSLAYVATATSY
jgi:hypothetical protein